MLVVCSKEICCHLYLSLKSRRSPACRWSRGFWSCKAVRREMLQEVLNWVLLGRGRNIGSADLRMLSIEEEEEKETLRWRDIFLSPR